MERRHGLFKILFCNQTSGNALPMQNDNDGGLADSQKIRNPSEKSLLYYDSNKRLEGNNMYQKLDPITIGWAQ
jgi:hypothetical protein